MVLVHKYRLFHKLVDMGNENIQACVHVHTHTHSHVFLFNTCNFLWLWLNTGLLFLKDRSLKCYKNIEIKKFQKKKKRKFLFSFQNWYQRFKSFKQLYFIKDQIFFNVLFLTIKCDQIFLNFTYYLFEIENFNIPETCIPPNIFDACSPWYTFV